MKTISEEYVHQLSQLHDAKASFGDAKGLKAIEKWLKEFKPQSIFDLIFVNWSSFMLIVNSLIILFYFVINNYKNNYIHFKYYL